MQAGIVLITGHCGEFSVWELARAWRRTVEIATTAEQVGLSYIWVPDHLKVIRGPDDGPMFEAFTTLGALANATSTIPIGAGVACAALRNPGLLQKMTSTLNVIADGRAELPIGSGNNEEWREFRLRLPPARVRLKGLEDALEVIDRGQPHRGSSDAESRVPIIVGATARR